MKISFYGYNAFLIESKEKKIAIDPGGLFLYFFRLTTLIPKSEWKGITHIFVTHGDPDHYWHTDRVADASGAPVIFNKTMLREVAGKMLALGPRNKGLAFTTAFARTQTLSVGETIQLDDMSIKGIKTTHGPLTLKIGPFSKTVSPGPNERVGWGAIGFDIQLDGKRIVNLGDTLLHTREWEELNGPDVLMIPIGGKAIHNTMDEREALQAVRIIRPKLVIPCHYNCPGLFSRKFNTANDALFKTEVEQVGHECAILGTGDSIFV